MKSFYSLWLLLFIHFSLNAQTANDILNLLIQNNTIRQEQADSLRAEAAIADQANQSKIKTFAVNAAKKVQLGAYAHIRYQFFQEDGKYDGLDIRRAYLDLRCNLTPYWSFRLQSDFANSPKIVDLYTEFKIKDAINFSLGQQSIPFSLNNVTSNTKLELADRSQIVEALSSRKDVILGDNNGRDMGLTVFGSLLDIHDLKLIEYRVGIFNGSGINRTDFNNAKDIIGRILIHPIKGLDIGGSYYYGWTPDSATIAKAFEKLKLTVDKDFRSTMTGLRQRYGVELSYTYKILTIKGEYLAGTDGKVNRSGYYGQLAAYVIPDKLQLAARYDTYDKDTDKDDNISTHYTLGINYYINPNIILQGAYTIRKEEGTAVANDLGSLQLQVAF
jgi:phosphate-selective porin OprO and OprP